jgi:hypothetical protein
MIWRSPVRPHWQSQARQTEALSSAQTEAFLFAQALSFSQAAERGRASLPLGANRSLHVIAQPQASACDQSIDRDQGLAVIRLLPGCAQPLRQGARCLRAHP